MGQLQDSMSSLEFARWLAYYRLEPDIGTKLDFLITWLGNVVSKSFTGESVIEDGKAIEWGNGGDEDNNEMLLAKVRAFVK